MVIELKSGLPIHSIFEIWAVRLPKLAPLISEKELTFHQAYITCLIIMQNQAKRLLFFQVVIVFAAGPVNYL